MCDSTRSQGSPRMTPLKGAFLAANPAGFLIFNKLNYGKVWPYGSHKKDQEGLNTEESQACLSSSSAAKKHLKKNLKKDKLELEQELYGFDDRDADARSTSSEVAPPVYSRK